MNDIEYLSSRLEINSKHGRYQSLPPELLKAIPSLRPFSQSKRHDCMRYDWISSKIDFNGKSILDIGANFGYFSFRLASERGAIITAYEPCVEHFEAICKIRNILGLSDDKFNVINRGVSIEDIDCLGDYDVALLLNVLQHAGEDFDKDHVHTIEQWREYSVGYLSRLSKHTRYLVFQMGYTWLGHNGLLCNDEEILDWTKDVLKESGWNIEHCGVLKNFLTNSSYSDQHLRSNQNNRIPMVNLLNRITSTIYNLSGRNRLSYRFMLRPLFICKRK